MPRPWRRALFLLTAAALVAHHSAGATAELPLHGPPTALEAARAADAALPPPADAAGFLDTLLAPSSVPAFFAQAYGRASLHVPRPAARDHFAHLAAETSGDLATLAAAFRADAAVRSGLKVSQCESPPPREPRRLPPTVAFPHEALATVELRSSRLE